MPKIGIKWLELFLITGDYEDEEMVLKLHRELREIKDLIK